MNWLAHATIEAMEENPEVEENTEQTRASRLHQVTPLSKYLAMILFVSLPFIGGWIGYTFAPEKIVGVEKELIREVEVEREVMVENENPTVLPVIAFAREGLLSDAERMSLNEKFIEPFVDYQQMLGHSEILTTVIEVPQNIGEPYVITSVSSEGNVGGFLFGERGGDYNYWTPGCFGECEFTDEYAQKYPEVLEQYNLNIQP